MGRMSWDERVYQIIIVTVVSLCVLMVIFPIYYVVAMSLTSQAQVIENGGKFVLFPDPVTFTGYSLIFSSEWVTNSMFISVARTITGTFSTLAFTTLGAFVLSRRELPGRKWLLLMVLMTLLFSGGLIPTFLLIKSLNLLNTFGVYIVPLLLDAWGLLIIKQFIENLPPGLDESARIDGASELQLLFRIILPLSFPVLAAIGLFQAVAAWNSWFDALIYVSNTKLWPFQMVLRNILLGHSLGPDHMQRVDMYASALLVNQQSLQMSAVVVGTIPILLVYPFLQKHFTKGMLTGAIKG